MRNEQQISDALRKYVRDNLTPTKDEQSMVSAVYRAVCSVLGEERCRQIGSYPRYTAIRPPHDLDVLYTAGEWRGAEPKAATVVADIWERLESALVPPLGLKFTVRVQTHSVTVSFVRNGQEVFAVDVVPAWTTGRRNEFGQDIYCVPEILHAGHPGRAKTYKRVAEQGGRIGYIFTDPKGYISVATAINKANPDFRKSVKAPKKWKWWAKKQNDEFKLKSFHIEQAITSYFHENPALEILEAVTRFFVELDRWISHSQIPDRADPSRKIDAYVDELTHEQRAIILGARDEFLSRLRAFDGTEDAAVLFEPRAAAAKATSTGMSRAPAIISQGRRVEPRPPFGEDAR